MGIIFEPYTGDTGSGAMALPLTVVGREQADYAVVKLLQKVAASGISAETGSGAAHLPLGVFGLDVGVADGIGKVRLAPLTVFGTDAGAPVPNVGVGSMRLPLNIHSQVSAGQVGSGVLHTALRVRGMEVADYGMVSLQSLRVYALETAPSRFATLYELPYVQSFGSDIVLMSVADTFKGSETLGADLIQALIDFITFNDSCSALVSVVQALADGMSVADIAQFIFQANLLDTFIASATPEGTAQITVMLADGVAIADTADVLATILASLADGFYATLTLNSGNDQFTAWVMTPETKAMRSYGNWPFNSYAQLGDMVLAAGEAGIYRLGGTDDAGAAIRSVIRTGLMAFGTEAMKANNKAYIGTTTSGALLMRVQATTFDGRRVEQTYRMVPSVVDDARAMRVDIGRGFRSVYWIFELANDEDGATFEVHDWHVLPVTLTGKLI